MQSGEALVRQFYFGKRWVEREFPGARQRTYWNVDVPGRTLQMPQILKKCGVDHLMYSRHQLGIYDWFAPDGSSVRVYTPGHYTRAAQFLHKNINLGINKFVDFMEEFPDYRKNPAQPRVVGMLSAEDM
ncbi:alpha-mannosidase, partial [human gut metagenome]